MAPRPEEPAPSAPIREADVSLAPLTGRTVAVLGYGTMGRAHARNLADSGVAVVVGARAGSPRGDLARSEGLDVTTPERAVAAGDVVALMLPDEAMAAVYRDSVRPHLRDGAALAFAHGFAIAFEQIVPDAGRPCFLVAPKAQGDLLREAYERGAGAPGLLAVTPDSPPATWELAAAYARAIGCLRGGGRRTTFREECVSDQFGEQVVLCGGVIALLEAAFDLLVARGYGRENAYFECVHELKLITDLVHRHGIDGMRQRISPTAAYGGLTRGPRVVDEHVRARLAAILDEIEDGRFAREFLARRDDPEHGIGALARREAASPLAETGRELRPALAAWDAAPAPAGPPPGSTDDSEERR